MQCNVKTKNNAEPKTMTRLIIHYFIKISCISFTKQISSIAINYNSYRRPKYLSKYPFQQDDNKKT